MFRRQRLGRRRRIVERTETQRQIDAIAQEIAPQVIHLQLDPQRRMLIEERRQVRNHAADRERRRQPDTQGSPQFAGPARVMLRFFQRLQERLDPRQVIRARFGEHDRARRSRQEHGTDLFLERGNDPRRRWLRVPELTASPGKAPGARHPHEEPQRRQGVTHVSHE